MAIKTELRSLEAQSSLCTVVPFPQKNSEKVRLYTSPVRISTNNGIDPNLKYLNTESPHVLMFENLQGNKVLYYILLFTCRIYIFRASKSDTNTRLSGVVAIAMGS